MITAWILMTFVSYNAGFQYSPPVATQEACEAMRAKTAKAMNYSTNFATCIKVEMHK